MLLEGNSFLDLVFPERVFRQPVGQMRLGQIALWRGAQSRAEQYFLEAVTALEGDAITRACAVDHVRYTRALTLRPDMPGALPPGALYAVEHGFLSAAVEAGIVRRVAWISADR